MFDREGKYGNRFYCNQHFGLSGTIKQRIAKNQEKYSRPSTKPKVKTPEKVCRLKNRNTDSSMLIFLLFLASDYAFSK